MKEVFLSGSSGLVGSRFVELFGNDYNLVTSKHRDFDITDSEKVKRFLYSDSPDVLVNFAAFTDVGAAENQRGNKNGLCWRVNVEGVRNLIDAVDLKKTHFIQISTDMVFSSSKDDPGPYDEDRERESDCEKMTWYGYSKARAEEISSAITVIRIIYPVRASYAAKLDYLRGPLAKFDKGELKTMFDDQQISITFIDEFCEALSRIIDYKKQGVFHVASGDTTTPYELVNYFIEKMRGKKSAIGKGSLDKLIEEGIIPFYRYPKYGSLKVEKTQEKLGMRFRTWREIVDELIRQGIG